MLRIACVKWGTKYGPEYVNILHDAVRRNLAEGTAGEFVCFTDDPAGLHPDISVRKLIPGLEGWWNKLKLFDAGTFDLNDDILYLDLDTVITGPLDEIASTRIDFGILRDFYRPDGLQSSVMKWVHGPMAWSIWTEWNYHNRPQGMGGDQEWIERWARDNHYAPTILQQAFPGAFVSYKVHARYGVPRGAKMVVFHGNPRPHEAGDWVPMVWKIGGGTSAEIVTVANTPETELIENIRHALTLDKPWLDQMPKTDAPALVVGGGPSLKNDLISIRGWQAMGAKVFATNATAKFLLEHDIRPDYQVILDARPEMLWMVEDVPVLVASQCSPKVQHFATMLWHPLIDGIQDIIGEQPAALVGGGTTVGLKTLCLAYILGHRELHLYGFDSCYSEGAHHAYPQALNDGERVLTAHAGQKTFQCAPWMVSQADDFEQIAPELIRLGCQLHVHGEGLIPTLAAIMEEAQTPDTEAVEIDGVYWPSKDAMARHYIGATMDDVDAILARCAGRKVAVQAGGNVGLWPKAFAKHFQAVYTFEPDWLNFQCLARNVTEPNVVKMQAALGDGPGLIDLARDPGNCGAHYVSGKGLIPTLTIDSLGLDACDLIQLDIEGYELHALHGAEETIRRFRPLVVLEDKGHGDRYGESADAIEAWMSAMGYDLVHTMHRDKVFAPRMVAAAGF